MFHDIAYKTEWIEIRAEALRRSIYWYCWLFIVLSVSLYVALISLRSGPDPILIGWMLYLAGVVAIFHQPRYGIYLLLFCGLLGDSTLMGWYPFAKNFSSRESIFFVNDSLIFSPLETYIALTAIAWLLHGVVRRKFQLHFGALTLPALAFTAWLVFGFMYGIGTGGALVIGLWEARPIFYLPAVLILTSNLITERQHTYHLMWLIMLALMIEGITGTHHYFYILNGSLAGVERITEHSAAVHMNTYFVYTIAAWLFGASMTRRLTLPVMLPFVVLTYLATQRRAAFLTLGIALVFMLFVLYTRRRTLFMMIAPPLAFMGLVYLGVFWNSSGALGAPAQAVKSVIAPDVGSADDLSNIYRIIENVNVSFTVHQVPLTGVGFGQKFYIIVPMADISFFDWWEYIVHNSIFWIWMKTGVFGFISMLFLVGFSIMQGVRVIFRMPTPDLLGVALVATLYIVMHFMYAYVDMSWDNQSMIYVGAMMGLVNCMERVVAKPVAVSEKRWPWQPDPEPEPGLLPIPGEASAS